MEEPIDLQECRLVALFLFIYLKMATNGKTGDSRRYGSIKNRSQALNPQTKQWVKRDAKTGKFMNVKQDGTPFKGVRKENS